MFDHLKKLEVKEATTWVELPELGPKARVCVRPATEANKPYFNAMLRSAGQRARRMARTDRMTAEDAQQSRAEDRQLFPRYVLVNWEGIEDTDGNPAAFNADHAREFCEKMPDWIFDKIRNAASTPERFLSEHDEGDPDAGELAGN